MVGYPPGGSGDFTTRTAADELARDLNVSVSPENKPGAAGTLANELRTKLDPDGDEFLNAATMAHHTAREP